MGEARGIPRNLNAQASLKNLGLAEFGLRFLATERLEANNSFAHRLLPWDR